MGLLDILFNRSKASKKAAEPEIPDERQYLFVPEKDRSTVIALGGRCDRDSNMFFVPPGFNRGPFAEWLSPQFVHRPDLISEERKAVLEAEVTVHRQQLEGTLISNDPALVDHLVEVKRQRLWRKEEEDRTMEKIFALKKGMEVPDPYLGTRPGVRIPYEDLERARECGVEWDRTAQKYIIPEGKDPAIFAEWDSIPPAMEPVASSPVLDPQPPETHRSVTHEPELGVPSGFEPVPVAGNDHSRVVVSARPSMVSSLSAAPLSVRSPERKPQAPTPQPTPTPNTGPGVETSRRPFEQTVQHNSVLSHKPQQVSQLITDYQTARAQDRGLTGGALVPLAPVLSHKPDIEETRHYIFVPVEDNKRVKALGGRVDPKWPSWYVPDGVDRTPFAEWEHPRTAHALKSDRDPRQEFANFLEAEGLIINGLPIMDGHRYRVRVNGDGPGPESSGSGSYKGFLDDHPAGTATNFKNGGVAKNWSGQPTMSLSQWEIGTQKARHAEQAHAKAREQNAKYDKVAEWVNQAWNRANPVTVADHTYLTKKRVLSYTLRVNQDGELLVPACDKNGEIRNLQRILPDGKKRFFKDGQVSGLSHRLDGFKESKTVILTEGFATAATLHELTGHTVITCFNASNLPKVARCLAEEGQNRPGVQFIVAADDDWKNPLKTPPLANDGLKYGQEAANILGGRMISPPLDDNDKKNGFTDFNDLCVAHGPDKCRDILSNLGAVASNARARDYAQAIG